MRRGEVKWRQSQRKVPTLQTPSQPTSQGHRIHCSIAPTSTHHHTSSHHVGRPRCSSVFPSSSSSIPARCDTFLRRSRGKACRCQQQASYRALRRRWHLRERSGTPANTLKTWQYMRRTCLTRSMAVYRGLQVAIPRFRLQSLGVPDPDLRERHPPAIHPRRTHPLR